MNFRFLFPPPPQVVSCLVLLSYFSLPSIVLGAIDGLQIMQQIYDKKQPETIETTVDMTLVDKSGTKRTRKIKSYTQHTDNRTNRILFFLSRPTLPEPVFLFMTTTKIDNPMISGFTCLHFTRPKG